MAPLVQNARKGLALAWTEGRTQAVVGLLVLTGEVGPLRRNQSVVMPAKQAAIVSRSWPTRLLRLVGSAYEIIFVSLSDLRYAFQRCSQVLGPSGLGDFF